MLSKLRKVGAAGILKLTLLGLLVAVVFALAGGPAEAQKGQPNPTIEAGALKVRLGTDAPVLLGLSSLESGDRWRVEVRNPNLSLTAVGCHGPEMGTWQTVPDDGYAYLEDSSEFTHYLTASAQCPLGQYVFVLNWRGAGSSRTHTTISQTWEILPEYSTISTPLSASVSATALKSTLHSASVSATALVVDGGETITLSGVVSNAPTTTWYGIADQNSSPGGLRLWEVNVTSPGQSVSLGGFSRRSFDYGVDSADGTTAYLATTEPNVPGSLRSFDPPARTLASHGDFPSGLGVVGGIATDGTVWYALDDSGDELWSLNVTTAASSTKVGDLTAGWGSPRGLATDGISWYGLDDDGDELWKLNVTTAASSTKVGDLTAGWDSPRGLATDGISWYGFDKDGGELWELNTASPGSSTEVGDMPSAFRTGNHEAAGILALGGRLRYSWSSSGGGAFGTPNATSTTWTAPAETGVEQAIELTWTATADGRAATSSVTVRVRSGFGLADFQDDGLVMDALGLIEAGPGHNLFGRAPRAESGSLNAGELGLGPDNIPITSFRTNEEGSEITLNDNHTAFRIGDYFDTGGAGDRLTMYVQTDDWLLTFPPGSIDVAGGNFARWDILDSTSQARLMGIEEHTRVILGFGRPSAVAPAIPAAPTITAASSTAVVISWVEPSDNNFAITSYDLRYREHGTSSWTDVFDHTTTSYTATELSVNTTYEAEVSATNEGGDSGYSPTGRGATDAVAPDTPARPSVTAISTTSIVISWVEPADNGADITSYDLRYREQGTASWTEVLDHTTTSYTATGLKVNTTYEAEVRATNAGGDSDYSQEGTATTGVLPPATPSAPTVKTESSTAVVISWTAPSDNGATITSYSIRYREQGTASWTEVLDHTTISYTATGLKVNTAYEAEVRATNAGGDSGFSQTGRGATAPGAPERPDAPFVTSASSTALLISWTAPANNGAAITSYDIRHRKRGTTPWTEVLGHTTTSYTATQLEPHVTYEAQVSATNSVGDSGHSTSGYGATSPPAIPDIPDRPVLEGVTFDSIRISWTAPAANGARINSYDLRFRELGTSSWIDVEDITTTMHTAANLQATSAYEAEVRATNSVGDSGYSQRGSGTTNPVLTSVQVESYFELPIRIARIEEAATTSGPYTASQVRPFGCVTNAQCLSTPHSTVSLGGGRVYRIAVTFDPISYGSPGEEGVVSVSYVTPTESGWSVLLGLDSFAAGNTSSFTVSPVSYQLSRGDNIQRAVFRLDGGGSGIEAGAEVSWVATFSIQYTDSNPLGNFSLVEIDAGVECDDCTRALTDISGETDRLSPSESLAVVDLGAPETSDAMQIVVVGDMEGFDWPGVSVLRGAAQTAGVEPRLVFAFGGFAALFAVFLLVLKLAQSLIIACIVAGVGMVLFGIPTIGLASTGVIVLFGLIAGAVLLVTKPGVT